MTGLSQAVPLASETPIGQIQRGDPVARLLARWRLSPPAVTLITATYSTAYGLALPALFGLLRTAHGVTGALDDWPNLVIVIVMLPLVFGYYTWQPAIIQATYDGIAARAGRNPAAAARGRELARPVGWAVWLPLALVVSTLETWIWIHDQIGSFGLHWFSANALLIIACIPERFAAFYALSFILVRQGVLLAGLNRFFAQFTVEIQPLHPDQAGGLRVLGDYALTNSLLLADVGLYFGMELLRARAYGFGLTVEYYGQLVLYLLAAPAMSLLPMLSVHARMREAKLKLLTEIAEQFDLEYRNLLDGLRRDELNLDDAERLEAIQKIYRIAQSSPEWPFDLGLASQLGAAILLPVLAPLAVNLLGNLLAK